MIISNEFEGNLPLLQIALKKCTDKKTLRSYTVQDAGKNIPKIWVRTSHEWLGYSRLFLPEQKKHPCVCARVFERGRKES
jgi:hypothetical protein